MVLKTRIQEITQGCLKITYQIGEGSKFWNGHCRVQLQVTKKDDQNMLKRLRPGLIVILYEIGD